MFYHKSNQRTLRRKAKAELLDSLDPAKDDYYDLWCVR